MIVLQNKSLPSVWTEFKALRELRPEDRLPRNWDGRRQCFRWVNNIGYEYKAGHKKKRMLLHLVACNEKWRDINRETNGREEKRTRHAWIFSEPLNRRNVHKHCNLGARHRWGIKTGFLVEKCHGYQYEHCFAESLNAIKDYHL